MSEWRARKPHANRQVNFKVLPIKVADNPATRRYIRKLDVPECVKHRVVALAESRDFYLSEECVLCNMCDMWKVSERVCDSTLLCVNLPRSACMCALQAAVCGGGRGYNGWRPGGCAAIRAKPAGAPLDQ